MRAARCGIIDFRRARLLDVNWWRYTNVLIDDMLQEDHRGILQMVHAFQCALIAHGNLTEESFKKAQERAWDKLDQYIATLWPWTAGDGRGARQEETDELIALYKQTQGDPNDPAFRAKLQADVEANQARELALRKPESAEQRVDRLLVERDAARKRR